MTAHAAGAIVDAVTAKVQLLREKYERAGYDVIERPGPEEFPPDIGYFGTYRPAMLARRGNENLVFEIREVVRSIGRLADRAEEFSKHPDWRYFLISCDDVVPHDAPGIQGEPPAWPELERTVPKTCAAVRSAPAWMQLLALWTTLEAVLRRVAVDHAIPVDRLSAIMLITALYDFGLIPFESYEPLSAAHEVHRRVRHGFAAPDDQVADAARVVSDWLPAMLPDRAERAA